MIYLLTDMFIDNSLDTEPPRVHAREKLGTWYTLIKLDGGERHTYKFYELVQNFINSISLELLRMSYSSKV